jgi:hypothetical protein
MSVYTFLDLKRRKTFSRDSELVLVARAKFSPSLEISQDGPLLGHKAPKKQAGNSPNRTTDLTQTRISPKGESYH